MRIPGQTKPQRFCDGVNAGTKPGGLCACLPALPRLPRGLGAKDGQPTVLPDNSSSTRIAKSPGQPRWKRLVSTQGQTCQLKGAPQAGNEGDGRIPRPSGPGRVCARSPRGSRGKGPRVRRDLTCRCVFLFCRLESSAWGPSAVWSSVFPAREPPARLWRQPGRWWGARALSSRPSPMADASVPS